MPGAIEVMRTLNEAINSHDVARAKGLLAPDAQLRLASGRTLDVDGYASFLQVSFTVFPDMHVEVLRWLTDGDVVMSEEMMTGTHQGEFAGIPGTGRPVALPMVHVARVADGGGIVELAAYHDTAGVARQLGPVP
jgi:hypothetical protein